MSNLAKYMPLFPQQLFGLIMTMFFVTLLILCLYYGVIKKQKAGKAPTNKIMMFLEIYYSAFDRLFTQVMSGKNH